MKTNALFAVGSALCLVACDNGGSDSETTGARPADDPQPVTDLLAANNLDSFQPVLKQASPSQEPSEVWKFENGQLHMTGRGWGYLRTREEHRDYHMTLEYRWGEYTAPERSGRARDAGIFFHTVAPDAAFEDSWPSSFEAQMVEGRAGDLIVIAALDRETGKKAAHRLTSEATEIEITDRPSDWKFIPGADSRDLPPPRLQRVRIFRDPHDSGWKDEKGYRSPDEIEQPVGDWNVLEVIANGDSVEVVLNGKTVNRAVGVRPAGGYLCLQSEMAECWIRKWQLQQIRE